MLKNFLFFLFLFKPLFTNDKMNNIITVSHTVLFQETYYETKDKISQSFIDFTKYKIYRLDLSRIYHKELKNDDDLKFELSWDEKKEITLNCSSSVGKFIKCAEIKLENHDFITFDIDKYIAKLGGIFSYLLILYGIFSLTSGYVYFNLTIIFYSSFGFLLFIREFCELLELRGNLNSEDKTSERISITVFAFALTISILYGAACHISKYLKYITFGFINGLIFSKIIYYYLIRILNDHFLLSYFLLELFSCLIMIALSIFIQNKYPKISIFNIAIITGYGIIYGISILFGGFPFLPYFIMAKNYKDKENLFKRLVEKNHVEIYGISYFVLIGIGYYFNDINYKIAMNKKSKSNKN